MKTLSCILFFILLNVGMHAQKSWFIGAGPTFLIPGKSLQSDFTEYRQLAGLPPFSSIEMDATGRFGLFAEAGRTWINRDNKVIHGFEIGIHYKSLTGREIVQAKPLTDSTDYFHQVTHKTRYVGLDLHLIREFDWTDKLTWRHMLGVNGDYGFIADQTEGSEILSLTSQPDREILVQLHYRLGITIKTNSRWSFMPSIETPVLNIYPWADGRSTLEIWNYRYRPVIFSVRIMLDDKPESKMDKGCLEIPENRETPQLWDKDMRKFRKGKSRGKAVN